MYSGNVYKALIASPSDVPKERDLISASIHHWNASHSFETKAVLLPIRWETHSSPEMGDRPQEILNRQIVKDCDLLVGVFWTRIGTPTGKAVSGTVEEIQEMMDAGKPVLIYFSSKPIPSKQINSEQYAKLSEFRLWCKKNGLVEEFKNLKELREKVDRQLNSHIRKLNSKNGVPDGGSRTLSIEEIRRISSLDKFMESYASAISQYTAEWNGERDSNPIGTKNGKEILANLKNDLVRISADPVVGKSPHIRQFLHGIIVRLNQSTRKILTIDGGKSFREFWALGDETFKCMERSLQLNSLVHAYLQRFTELFRQITKAAGADLTEIQLLPRFSVLPSEPAYDGHIELILEARFPGGRRWSLFFIHGGTNPGQERLPELDVTLSQPGEESHGINYLLVRFSSPGEDLLFDTGTPIDSLKPLLNTGPQSINNFDATISDLMGKMAEHEKQ